MPKGTYKGQADAQCPFYRSDDDQAKKILCEGLVDRSSIALFYHRKKDYVAQLGIFCCEYYKKCEIYRMLMAAKYDEEDIV